MIFVIVIMGILAKFGSEIFRNVYQNYINSTANNELQIETELVLQQIGNRLQYRIKDSVIARRSDGTFTAMNAVNDANHTTFEWIGYDIDGWLGDDTNTTPTWSGFIDVSDPTATTTLLVSPASDFTAGGRVDTVIQALGGDSGACTRWSCESTTIQNRKRITPNALRLNDSFDSHFCLYCDN